MSIISLYEKSENLFFVGGVVRDELLGKTSPDIDLTFVGNAIEFAKSLDFEILQENEEFGSIHLKIDNKTIDITSTRTEKYPKKGHLPVVEKIGCSLKDDLKRRDFTVNALAKNCKSGEIVDLVGGIEDLKNKKMRVFHDESFVDDPTRIVRGLKFAVRFNFELEEHTKKLQEEYLKNVNYDMSFKRLKDELKDAFNLDKQRVLDLFVEQKVYKLLSESENFSKYLCEVEEFVKPYLSEIDNVWLVYLCGFELKNLPLTKKEFKILENLKMLLTSDFENDFELFKMFKNMDIESILGYGLIKNPEITKKYLDFYRKIKLTINGDDLMEMGYEPSKKIAEALESVLQYKYANPDMNHAEELAIAKKFM